MPSVLFADPDNIVLWGKVYHHLLSPGDVVWPSGTKINQITADIIKGIERMINQTILEYKLPATVEVGITEEGLLKILVWAFGDNYYPIFFVETLEAVKPISTKLQALVQEALILMGSRTLMNWEDVKYMLDDHLEIMYDEAEVPEMRKKYEKCGPAVSPFIRCKDGEMKKRIALFTKMVQRLKPRGEKQNMAVELLRAVVEVLQSEVIFEFAPTEHEDMHIELGRIMPILYTGTDDLTDYHYEEMNDYWQGGGAIFGEQLEFLITDPKYLKGNQILKRLDRFRSEIRTLSLYERIFSIIDQLTRKEAKPDEQDLHAQSSDDTL